MLTRNPCNSLGIDVGVGRLGGLPEATCVLINFGGSLQCLLVPHLLHLLMMILTVFLSTFSAFDILLHALLIGTFQKIKSRSFSGGSLNPVPPNENGT